MGSSLSQAQLTEQNLIKEIKDYLTDCNNAQELTIITVKDKKGNTVRSLQITQQDLQNTEEFCKKLPTEIHAFLYDHLKQHNDYQQHKFRDNAVAALPWLAGGVLAGLLSVLFFSSVIFSGGLALPLVAAIPIVIGNFFVPSLLTPLLTATLKEARDYLLDTDKKKVAAAQKQHPDAKLLDIPAPTNWQKFWRCVFFPVTLLNNILRFIIGHTILSIPFPIVAWIANSGNPHYHTPVGSVKDTLKPLIFPGGTHVPHIHTDNAVIDLAPVRGAQLESLREYNKQHKGKFTEFKGILPNGTVLTGVEARSIDNDNSNSKDDLHIVYFNGNSGCYQGDAPDVLEDLAAFRKENKHVTSVQFNYPGVLNSYAEVDNIQELITAGIAQVQRLIDDGVPPNKIVLRGESLGGAVAANVGAFFHARRQTLKLTYVTITFSSTLNVAVSYVNKIPKIGPLLGVLFRPFIIFGLWGTRQEPDTAGHFVAIPEANREYSLVRSKEVLRELANGDADQHPVDDAVIAHYASLHTSRHLKIRRKWEKLKIRLGFSNKTMLQWKQENAARKMMVCQVDATGDNATYQPAVCGHAGVSDAMRLIHRLYQLQDGTVKDGPGPVMSHEDRVKFRAAAAA